MPIRGPDPTPIDSLFQRHDISRLPEIEGDTGRKKAFKHCQRFDRLGDQRRSRH